MGNNGDFFDNGIGPEELGIFLGISEELAEEEAAKLLEKENEPENVTPDHLEKEGLIPDAGGDTDVDNYWDEEY